MQTENAALQHETDMHHLSFELDEEEAHPEQDEVVMQPVEAKIEDLGNPETPEQDEAIVANWLNKSKMETPETVYAKAYNTWVSAWNGTLSGGEDRFRASTYEQLRGDN